MEENKHGNQNWPPTKKFGGEGVGALRFGVHHTDFIRTHQFVMGGELPVEIYP